MEANSSPTHKPVNQAIAGIEVGTPAIFTHGGNFHADDLWACALIREFYPGFSSCPIVRTRDEKVLAAVKATRDPIHGPQGFMLVDVGGEFDKSAGWFDHHQKDTPCRVGQLKYAAAGMVWDSVKLPPMVGWKKKSILEKMAYTIDSVDNGVKVEGWDLSMVLHKCNPLNPVEGDSFDDRFDYLVRALQDVLWGILWAGLDVGGVELVAKTIEAIPQVREWVAEYDAALAASEARIRIAFEQPGPLLVLGSYEPALMDIAPQAQPGKLFSIYPSPQGEWMIQQIPVEKGNFAGRKQLPEAWAAKRGADLDAVTGVEGGVFVHAARFIGGHKTLEGAKAMALAAATHEG